MSLFAIVAIKTRTFKLNAHISRNNSVDLTIALKAVRSVANLESIALLL